jgi:tRNA isopentenyl-2-thiomethyl-A-37 hydroxylase MiaE
MPKIFEYPLQISLYHGLIACCTLVFLNVSSNLYSILGKELRFISFSNLSTQKFAKYNLQNRVYSQKHSTYTSKALKCTLYIKKRSQKQLEVLVRYLSNLLFSMYSGLILLYSLLISSL